MLLVAMNHREVVNADNSWSNYLSVDTQHKHAANHRNLVASRSCASMRLRHERFTNHHYLVESPSRPSLGSGT